MLIQAVSGNREATLILEHHLGHSCIKNGPKNLPENYRPVSLTIIIPDIYLRPP